MFNNKLLKNSFVYLVIGLVVIIVLVMLGPAFGSKEDSSLTQVITYARQGRVSGIVVNGNDLTVKLTDGEQVKSRKEEGTSIYELLQNAGVEDVEVTSKGASGLGSIFGVLINFLPLIFFGALLLFMMRQAQGSNNQTMNFGRSKAQMFVSNQSSVSFDDVAGAEEAKEELKEVVEFLKFPDQFLALGARIPKGVLLVGPPGTGKTLLARAVAGEAAVPFFSISGSEFVEMFVGVGASRVRDLFGQAKRSAPCIVFVDEIDAVGRHRGAGLGGGHDEREQTLNQILVEMDGFDTSINIIVIAATNRPDILDPALLRPGRFDRRVVLDRPDVKGRKEILAVHTKGKPIDKEVDMDLIAKLTPGFSGADLSNLVNESAILAARQKNKVVKMPDFLESIDRVIAGPERRSRVISPKEKKITAYHEAGHVLVGWFLPNADPPIKVTIVSRGSMGGYTKTEQEDRYLLNKSQFEDRIAMAMGGRVAEEIIFNQITTGASNDLEQATKDARSMVTRFGMSFVPDQGYEVVPLSTVVEWMNGSKLEKIDVYGDDIILHTKDGENYRSRKEPDTTVSELLRQNGGKGVEDVKVDIVSAAGLDKLGPRVYGKREEMVFLGKEISEERDYSNETAKLIDEEVNHLLSKAYRSARDVLVAHEDKLKQVAEYLLKKETAEGDELKKLLESDISEERVVSPQHVSADPMSVPNPTLSSAQESGLQDDKEAAS